MTSTYETVREALDNSVENGYNLAPPYNAPAMAIDLKDTCSDCEKMSLHDILMCVEDWVRNREAPPPK